MARGSGVTANNSGRMLQIIRAICVVQIGFLLGGCFIIKSYQNFGLRARQAEVKMNLAHLYVLQHEFLDEKGRFTDDLQSVGFTPEKTFRYRYGFVSTAGFSRFRSLCQDCVAGEKTFRLIAVGNLDKDTTPDVWTMDQEKNLIHIVDDVEH